MLIYVSLVNLLIKDFNRLFCLRKIDFDYALHSICKNCACNNQMLYIIRQTSNLYTRLSSRNGFVSSSVPGISDGRR